MLLVALTVAACASGAQIEPIGQLRERVFSLASVQAVYMDSLLTEAGGTDTVCPKTFQDGKLVTSDIGWWCSGFYPGVLWLIYENTGDEAVRTLAVKHTLPLSALLYRRTDHDICF